MFERILKSVRLSAARFLLAHLLLVAFAPLLHAHSVVPEEYAGGFHLHLASLESDITICPQSGQLQMVVTAEVNESRTREQYTDVPANPVPRAAAPVLSQDADPPRHVAPKPSARSSAPNPGALPPAVAAPQAP